MLVFRTVLMVLFLAVLLGCGKGTSEGENVYTEKSSDDQPVESDESDGDSKGEKGLFAGLQQLGESISAAKKGFEATAKAVKKMEETAEKRPVKPVHFRELLEVLPSPPDGWEIVEGSKTGETSKFGSLTFSVVAQGYKSQDGTFVKISVQDTAFIPVLQSALHFASVIEQETMDGYKRGIEEEGKVGFVEFSFKEKKGTLDVIYKDRFLISISLRGTDNDKLLQEWLQRIDFSKLDELADKYNEPVEQLAETEN